MKTSPHEFLADPQNSSVIVPMDSAELEALDNWIGKQGNPKLSRTDAIRMMIIMALSDRRQQPRHSSWP